MIYHVINKKIKLDAVNRRQAGDLFDDGLRDLAEKGIAKFDFPGEQITFLE